MSGLESNRHDRRRGRAAIAPNQIGQVVDHHVNERRSPAPSFSSNSLRRFIYHGRQGASGNPDFSSRTWGSAVLYTAADPGLEGLTLIVSGGLENQKNVIAPCATTERHESEAQRLPWQG